MFSQRSREVTAGKKQPSVLKDNVMDNVTMKEDDERQATWRFWKSDGVRWLPCSGVSRK